MRHIFSSTFVLLFLLSAVTLRAEELGHTTDSLETVKKNVADQKAVLVDVRDESEWNRGHA